MCGKITQTARTRLASIVPKATIYAKPIAGLWIHGAIVSALYFIIVYSFTNIVKSITNLLITFTVLIILFIAMSIILGLANRVISTRLWNAEVDSISIKRLLGYGAILLILSYIAVFFIVTIPLVVSPHIATTIFTYAILLMVLGVLGKKLTA